MKKNLIYCVSAAILAMVFMLAGQANAQEDITDCEAFLSGNTLFIQCGASDDVIEVFAEYNDARELITFVDIGDGEGPVAYGRTVNSNINIDTGAGSDDVSVHDTTGKFPLETAAVFLFIKTGRGPDKVSVGPNVQTLGLGIDTGEDGDTVLLGLNVDSEIGVYVFTRGGPDVVRTFAAVPMGISGVIALDGDIIIDGGGDPGDVDAIVIGEGSLYSKNVYNSRTRITGFETFGRPDLPGILTER